MPALGTARARSRQARCLSNAASAAQVVHIYAADAAGWIPYGGDTRRTVHIEGAGDFRVGGRRGLIHGRWAALFPDHWSGGAWSPGLRCPMQTPDPEQSPTHPLPSLYMSAAIWYSPATLYPGAPWQRVGWGGQRIDNVVFPSKKSLFFEEIAFCIDAPAARDAMRRGITPYWPESIAFVDGSARRLVRANGLPGVFSLPYDVTTYGVRGRDEP